jgi:hypothetical protein
MKLGMNNKRKTGNVTDNKEHIFKHATGQRINYKGN